MHAHTVSSRSLFLQEAMQASLNGSIFTKFAFMHFNVRNYVTILTISLLMLALHAKEVLFIFLAVS